MAQGRCCEQGTSQGWTQKLSMDARLRLLWMLLLLLLLLLVVLPPPAVGPPGVGCQYAAE
jgi:predicted nucleic acid-binding Zn ribbon protein